MIAERHTIGACGEELVTDRFCDPETARGVLAIDDNEIQRPKLPQTRQTAGDRGAAGPANDVADKQQAEVGRGGSGCHAGF